MEDIRYKRKKDTQETSEKFSRNEHDGHKGASLVKDGGEENYETKVALSGKLLNPCLIVAWSVC